MVAIICSIIVIIIIVAFISAIIFKNRMYQFYDRLRPGYHKVSKFFYLQIFF